MQFGHLAAFSEQNDFTNDIFLSSKNVYFSLLYTIFAVKVDSLNIKLILAIVSPDKNTFYLF